MRRSTTALLAVLSLVALALVVSVPAQAQGGSITYDFTSMTGPFVPNNADTEWVPGVGWQATDWYPLDANNWHMYDAAIKTCLGSSGTLGITGWEMEIVPVDPGPSPNFSYNYVYGAKDGSANTQDFNTTVSTFTQSVSWSTGTEIVFSLGQRWPGSYFGDGAQITAWNAWADGETWAITSLTLTYSGSLPAWDCGAEDAPTVDLTCPEEATQGYAVTLEETHTGAVTDWDWDLGDTNVSHEGDGDVEYTYYDDGEITVELTLTGPGGIASDSCEITVLRIGQPGSDGSGVLYRPIHTMDSDTGLDWPDTPIGLFSAAAAWGAALSWSSLYPDLLNVGPDDETVIGVSNHADTNVYAVADGTILDIQPLSVGDCDPLEINDNGGNLCAFRLYGEDITGDFFSFAEMSVNPFGLYKVTVSYFGDIVIEYYVANAPLYVRTGQELLAGCIVGETTPYTYSPVNVLIGVQPPEPERDGGSMFWMQAVQLSDEQQVPILAMMLADPDPDTACNAGGEYSDCLFDPTFQRRTMWDETGTVSWADGVTLQPGASISMTNLTLDAATAYAFTVWTEYPSTYGATVPRMTLSVGTTSTSFLLTEHVRTRWAIASATHTADNGALYTIRIANSGPAPFTVLQNCLSAGEPNTAPSACYFQNPTFDGQLTGWTTSGTVIPDPSGPVNGQIAIMSDNATIGQNVTLYADGGGGDHEYTMNIEGVLHATANSAITIRYRFGGGGWVTPSVSGWTYNEQSLTALQPTYHLEFDLPSGTFAGLLELQFDFTAAGSDAIGTTLWLSVYSACLSDSGGWAHHPIGGGSDWTPGAGCDNSAPPVELQDDFGAWISYHLDGMQDIYYCDVIPQLEQLNNVTYSIYEYAQWTGLYSQAVQAQTMNWADKSLFPWLNGHLSNIAMAAGGAMGVDVGGGCHDIFCLLDAIVRAVVGPIIDVVSRIVDTILGLFTTIVDVLLPLVEAVIGLFVSLIGSVVSLLNSLITLISAFVTGITNAQPAPVPGLPNCAINPNSSAICAVMYGLDQTVFADEGAAIIPLFIGILSIVQLSWLISKLLELIGEVADRI